MRQYVQILFTGGEIDIKSRQQLPEGGLTLAEVLNSFSKESTLRKLADFLIIAISQEPLTVDSGIPVYIPDLVYSQNDIRLTQPCGVYAINIPDITWQVRQRDESSTWQSLASKSALLVKTLAEYRVSDDLDDNLDFIEEFAAFLDVVGDESKYTGGGLYTFDSTMLEAPIEVYTTHLAAKRYELQKLLQKSLPDSPYVRFGITDVLETELSLC